MQRSYYMAILVVATIACAACTFKLERPAMFACEGADCSDAASSDGGLAGFDHVWRARDYSGDGDVISNGDTPLSAMFGISAAGDPQDPQFIDFPGFAFAHKDDPSDHFVAPASQAQNLLAGKDLSVRIRVRVDFTASENNELFALGGGNEGGDTGGLAFRISGFLSQPYVFWRNAADNDYIAVSFDTIELAEYSNLWTWWRLDYDAGTNEWLCSVSFDDTNDDSQVNWTSLGTRTNMAEPPINYGGSNPIRILSGSGTGSWSVAGSVSVAKAFYDDILTIDFDVPRDGKVSGWNSQTTGEAYQIARSAPDLGALIVDRPAFHLSREDHFTIADHLDLDFDSTTGATVFVVLRRHVDGEEFARIMSKRLNTGWEIWYGASSENEASIAVQGVAGSGLATVAAAPVGDVEVLVFRYSGDVLIADTAGGTITTTSSAPIGELGNEAPLRIGGVIDAGQSFAGEIFAWGVASRALSDAEVAQLIADEL